MTFIRFAYQKPRLVYLYIHITYTYMYICIIHVRITMYTERPLSFYNTCHLIFKKKKKK